MSNANKLREEFRNDYKGTTYDFNYDGDLNAIANYWLQKLTSQKQQILQLIEGKKKELHYADGGELSYFKHTTVQGYNQALEDITKSINDTF